MYRNLAIFLVVVLVLVVFAQMLLNRKKLAWPVHGNVTSKYGNRIHPITGASQFHNGIDLAVSNGTKVLSPGSGKVVNKYYNSTGGNQLVVKHDNGLTTGYAHLSDTLVNIGQRVSKNQIIAKTGSTGAVTGPHLHLTVKDSTGNYVDPQKVFK